MKPNYLALPHILHAGRFSGDHDVNWHTHPGCELVLVTSGRCDYRMSGRDFQGPSGTLFICPDEVPQYQVSMGHCETTYISFLWNQDSFDVSARTVALDLNSAARRWIEDICDLWTGTRLGCKTQMECLLLAVLDQITGHEAQEQNSRGLHPALTQAQSFIEAMIDRPINVAEVAKACHVSPGYLNELFNAAHGCGPLEFHKRRRLARAARLLLSPYLSVLQVALQCGYSDANFFTRQFRGFFGQTPTDYRKSMNAPD